MSTITTRSERSNLSIALPTESCAVAAQQLRERLARFLFAPAIEAAAPLARAARQGRLEGVKKLLTTVWLASFLRRSGIA
jgi:hypothetical protein